MAIRFCIPAMIVTFAWTTVGLGQQVSVLPSVLDSHPTLAEFRDEITDADIVVRAKIVKILRRRDGKLGDEDVIIEPIHVYKGQFDSEQPSVRIEFFQSLEYKPDTRLPNVGEEVFLPIDVVHPYTGAAPAGGEKQHYFARFYYTVAADGTVNSIFGVPAETQAHANASAFDKLIADEINRPHPEPVAFETAEALFFDDFNDGSLAGWTFLDGERGFRKMPAGQTPWFDGWLDETWIGPESILHNKLPDGTESPPTRMQRDRQTGVIQGWMNGDETTGREVEHGERRFLLSILHPQTGLAFVPELVNKGQGKYSYHSWDQSRALRALVRWYAAVPSERDRLGPLINRMVRGLDEFSDIRGDDPTWGPYACWSADEFDQDQNPVPHPFGPEYPNVGEVIPDPAGSSIEPLVMCAQLGDHPEALDLAVRFANGELGQHRADKFSPDQKRFAGFAPNGSFAGHFHSKSTTLIGIAKLARYLAEHDRLDEGRRYLRAVRKSYDWIFAADNAGRGSRIGWFPERPSVNYSEMCCTADMIELAEAMAQCAFVDPEFRDWANLHDDVEAMTVNMTARSQIRLTPEFERALAASYGENASPQLAIARRLDGASPTNPLPNDLGAPIPMSGCCQHASVRAMYCVWRGAVTYDHGQLRVNYFLNCRSPQATVSTALPALGTAEIRLHADADVFVRVPQWLEPSEMTLTVGARAINPSAGLDATGHYIRVGKLSAGDRITIEFSLKNRTTEERIGAVPYNLSWRGNYVVRMTPVGRAFPFYP